MVSWLLPKWTIITLKCSKPRSVTVLSVKPRRTQTFPNVESETIIMLKKKD